MAKASILSIAYPSLLRHVVVTPGAERRRENRLDPARYSTRRVIPFDLQAHYGRREIVRALGTADPAEAQKLHLKMWLQLDGEFDQVRRQMRDDAGIYEETSVEEISPTVISLSMVDDLRKERDEAFKRGQLQAFMVKTHDALRLAQAMFNGELPSSHPMRTIEGRRNALHSFLTGENSFAIAAARKARHAVDEEQRGAQEGVGLADVVRRWAGEAKPSARTIKRTENIVQRFSEAVGVTDVCGVRRADVIAWKDQLLAEGQTPANINVMIPMLGTVLNYAVANCMIESNPAAKVRVSDNRRAKEKRRPFSEDELALWFSSPIYTSGHRPSAGGGEASYWLPLLALYTGARQTELGQLHPSDICQEAYLLADGTKASAWVIKLVENAERGQRVKTEGSERRIPIHSDIISLGFLDLVQDAAQAKRNRIFHRIKPSAQGELMGSWSKWFTRHRKSLGIVDQGVVFHSFRHNFKQHARWAGIPSEVHNALTGHETGDVADAYGAMTFPLRPLVEAMADYQVPNFQLPPKP